MSKQMIQMQINVQYSFRNPQNKLSSVFPVLSGIRKRILTEGQQFLHNSKTPIAAHINHRKQDQITFLNRMKKAKDIILFHNRRNKNINSKEEDESFQFPRSKTEDHHRKFKSNTQSIKNKNMKYFHSYSKCMEKKESFGYEKYNDRFMRNTKILLSEKLQNKQQEQRDRFYPIKSPKIQDFRKNHLKFGGSPKQSHEKMLMRLTLSEQLISQNGSKLVEKLIKCRTSKNAQQTPNTSLGNSTSQTQKCDSPNLNQSCKKSVSLPACTACSNKSVSNLKIQFSMESRKKKKKNIMGIDHKKLEEIQNDSKQADEKDFELFESRSKSKMNSLKRFLNNKTKCKKQNKDGQRAGQCKTEEEGNIKSENNIIKLKFHKNRFFPNEKRNMIELQETNFKVEGWNLKQQTQIPENVMDDIEIIKRRQIFL